MKPAFLFSMFLVIIGCVSTPLWISQTPFQKKGRKYFSSSALLENKKIEEAEKFAIKSAKEKISQSIQSYVKSHSIFKIHRTVTNSKVVLKKVLRTVTFLETEMVLEGVRLEKKYSDGIRIYVLLSIDKNRLEPTLENFQKNAENRARRYFQNKKWAKAGESLKAFLLLGKDKESRHRNILKKELICYEKGKIYDEGIRSISSFLNEHPKSPEAVFFQKEKQRFIKELEKNLSSINWDSGLLMLKILFSQYQNSSFKTISLQDSYDLREKITLQIHLREKKTWQIIWMDRDGIYDLESFSKKKYIAFQGTKNITLASGTKKGKVLLLLFSGKKKLSLPIREILLSKLEMDDQGAKQNLARLIQFLKTSFRDGEYATRMLSFVIR